MLTQSQDQRLVEALEVLIESAPDASYLKFEASETEPPMRSRRGGPAAAMWVSALAFVVVMALAAPLLLFSGGESKVPVGASTPTTVAPQPSPVWPPLVPQAEAPAGATWVCPSVPPSEGDRQLDPADIPDDLRYLTTSGTETFTRVWGVHRGQACGRGPALVAVQFADSDQTRTSAVVSVWVEIELSEIAGWDAMWDWLDSTPTRTDGEITVVDGFTVRFTPGTETFPSRVVMVGVLDGLPVWITSSGLTPDQLALLVAEMTADAVTGQVELATQEFTVVHSEPVTAKLIDIIEWYVEIDDPTHAVSDVEVRYEPGFNPYNIEAGWFTYIPVGATKGLVGREGGGTARLTWSIAPGIVATVIGTGTTDELIDLAERLTLVEPDDPRIP